ncbi:TPA: tape measure protein [Pseudomonas aeruginosa]|nr:tape measure protein [Pseudomonas aeruginosa]
MAVKGKDLELALRIRADLSDAIAKLRQFESGLDGTGAAAKRASGGLGATGNAASKVRSEIGQLPALLRNLAGLFATAFSAREIARAAETYTTIHNRLALVTKSSEGLANAQDAVFQIAQDARQPLDATAELYQRIATNADALNLSASGVAGVVDTINKTLAISGTSGPAASAALVQLGQAFASGTLRGEELNSVLEQAPALAKTLADGLGVPVGKLRELGETGKLSAQNVIQALESQAATVNQQFSKIQVTGSQALTVLGNSLTRVVGELNEATGASSAFGEMVVDLSTWLDSGTLTNGLLDSLSIWGGVFDAIGGDIQSLNLDLDGLAKGGDETALFLAQAFKEMPANLRSAIQLATVEILALFDKAIAYADYAWKSIQETFSANTQAAVIQQLEQRLQQINDLRSESIDSILAERDAILQGAQADRQRRDEERKAREEARAQRTKDIGLLREQAKAGGMTLGSGRSEAADKQAKDAEKYVKQLERQAAVLGLTAAQVRAYELAEKGLTGTLLARAKASQAALDAADATARATLNARANAGLVTEYLRSTGRDTDAATQEVGNRFAQMRADFQKSGNEAGLALIDKLIPVEQAKIKLDALQAEISKAFDSQSRTEQSIDAQVNAGLITELEGRQRLVDLHRETADTVEQYLPTLREMANIPGPMGEQARAALETIETQLIQLRTTTNELQNALRDGLQNGIEQSLKGLAAGTMNLRDAVNSFVQGIAQSMAALAAQQLASMATSSAMSLFGGGDNNGSDMTAGAAAVTGSAAALATAGSTLLTGAAAIEAAAATLAAANGKTIPGGSSDTSGWLSSIASWFSSSSGGASAGGAGSYTGALGFATGGHVRGPGTSTSDSIPALLSDYEYVTRAAVVTQPGALTFLDDFNARGMVAIDDWSSRIRHSTGGLAGVPAPALPAPRLGNGRLAETGSSRSTMVKNAINLNLVDSPERIASVLATQAGTDVFTVMLSRDPAKFRSILGVRD